MSDEVVVETPVTEPAASPETEATPATETQAAPEVKSEADAKTFTQEQLNEIVQKEKAKAEAKAERRALKAYRETLERVIPQQQQAPQQADTGRPTRSQFNDDDDYVEAMTDWKMGQRDQAARQSQQAQVARTVETKTESIYAEAQKIPGFDRQEFDELPLTPAIAAALVDSDVPAQLMHYMAANPGEVAEIAKLSPARQAAAIGKLEDKVSKAPAMSKAPPPLKAVGTRGSPGNGDMAKASMDDYIAIRAKQGARWAKR